MASQARNALLVVGLLGVVVAGGLFVLAYDRRPFGLIGPVVEAVLLSLVMGPLLALSVSLQHRFDVEHYVRDRAAAGVGLDLARVVIVASLFGIASGLILGFVTEAPLIRIAVTAIVEYFSAFWVFSMANADYYDDRHIRRAIGR
ncbi:MAG: hypothetical protein ACOC42_03345 [Halobacteriota archaeon]